VNSVHDLGGTDGFGPVVTEADEPVFHARWEGRTYAMVAAAVGARVANVHEFRHAIERMAPVHYLESSYYEHWLTALATLLVEKGLVARAELEREAPGFSLARPVHPRAQPPSASSGAAARFAPGDRVVVRCDHPPGHTRCPRYVRGRPGRVVRLGDRCALPDAAAHGGKARQFTYIVRFEGRDLWGGAAEPDTAVYVDLSEGYLEAP